MRNREKLLKLAQTNEDKLLISKALDAAYLYKKYNAPRFTDFLDERQLDIVLRVLKGCGVPCFSYGGYTDARRQMVCVYDTQALYPFCAVSVFGHKTSELIHRDLLGSVLALGIKRDKVGDIFFDKERWIVYAENTVADFISQNMERVGGTFVNCALCSVDEISPPRQKFDEIRGTVATLRLDSVVSLFMGCSREVAAKSIGAKRVVVNHIVQTSNSYSIDEGDVISIRGVGKAKVTIGGKSRKGRIFVSVLKYV